ncbi:hypothetical protein [Methylomicrobium album]|uniref:hypothetical protein n=1 Tax=Methylomicrobium album TaxID=39775 RepID=UPI001BC88A2B|nr:hypothetical protein [Methylomicrobium album]
MSSKDPIYDSQSFWEYIDSLVESNIIPEVQEIGDGIGQAITSGDFPMLVKIADDDDYLKLESIVQYKGASVEKLLSIANNMNCYSMSGYIFFCIEEEYAIGMKASLPVSMGVTLNTVTLFIRSFFDDVAIFAENIDRAFTSPRRSD